MRGNVTALFEGIAEDAFRLETRQRYNVPYEEPLIRDFEAGKPAPESNQEIIRYKAMLRVLRAAGKRPYRVHVIELPLNPLPAL